MLSMLLSSYNAVMLPKPFRFHLDIWVSYETQFSFSDDVGTAFIDLSGTSSLTAWGQWSDRGLHISSG